MQTLSDIRAMLADRGLKPKHRLGQNFLHDKNQLQKLIDAANVQHGDLLLEVGPGTGTLTEALLAAGAKVIASEVDADMAAIVRDRIGKQITLIEGDVLESGRRLSQPVFREIGERPFKLVANLPYQIASPLMARLLIGHPNCRGQWVTIQKEVADRLLAKPSTKEYGPLSIIVQTLGRVRRIATLKPNSFWPPPKVTSAMIEILPRDMREHGVNDAEAFATFVTQLFTKRRKQLGTIFGRDGHDGNWPLGAAAETRPDALSSEQVVQLWQARQHA